MATGTTASRAASKNTIGTWRPIVTLSACGVDSAKRGNLRCLILIRYSCGKSFPRYLHRNVSSSSAPVFASISVGGHVSAERVSVPDTNCGPSVFRPPAEDCDPAAIDRLRQHTGHQDSVPAGDRGYRPSVRNPK